MAKAVLISIRPEWVEKILAGEKTLEVRKTRPKMETPFKCYIYCTKNEKGSDRLWVLREQIRKEYNGLSAVCANLRAQPDLHSVGNRYVVGEFVCDKITRLTHVGFSGLPGIRLVAMKDRYTIDDSFAISKSLLTTRQIEKYLDRKDGYVWHISNLKIYDDPKQLSEFKGLCKIEADCGCCPYYNYTKMDCDGRTIRRPPQSWCYAEELV